MQESAKNPISFKEGSVNRFDVVPKSELEAKLKYVCGTLHHKMFEDEQFKYFVTDMGNDNYEIFYKTKKETVKPK